MADAIVKELVADVSSRSGAFSLLEKKLVLLSNQGNELPADELLLIIRQVGSKLPEDQAQILASRFATSKPGVIDAASLLQSVRAAV